MCNHFWHGLNVKIICMIWYHLWYLNYHVYLMYFYIQISRQIICVEHNWYQKLDKLIIIVEEIKQDIYTLLKSFNILRTFKHLYSIIISNSFLALCVSCVWLLRLILSHKISLIMTVREFRILNDRISLIIHSI